MTTSVIEMLQEIKIIPDKALIGSICVYNKFLIRVVQLLIQSYWF